MTTPAHAFEYGLPNNDIETAQERSLRNQLPWLTAEERSDYKLADHPAWPGLFPEPGEMAAFIQLLYKQSTRMVSCRFDLGYVEMSGHFDLVSGKLYIMEDGEYVVATDFPEEVTIVFDQLKPVERLLVRVIDGVAVRTPEAEDAANNAQPMSLSKLLARKPNRTLPGHLASLVEQLAYAGKLPAVEVSQ